MNSQPLEPLHVFRFELFFEELPLPGSPRGNAALPAGAFSECTGLEATLEPKVIKAGGHNLGAFQRVGPVTYSTVVLKRGISRDGRLYKWFERVAGGDYGHRCTVRVTLRSPSSQAGRADEDVLTWRMERALPVKFKAADFNARATEVGIEELHLVHEGLFLELSRSSQGGSQS
jgi:phage tail-like protein